MADKDLRFKILAQVVGAEQVDKFSGSLNNLDKTATGMKGKLGSLTAGVKALAAAYVVTEAVRFTKSLIDIGDELDELSEKTGVAVKDLSGFQAIAQIEGIAVNELTSNLKKLSIAVVEASSGSKNYVEVFKSIGVNVKDSSGNIKNSGVILKEISDRFSKMENGAAKAAVAVKLFGKSGTDFIPFLNKGSAELERFSLAIDDDFAKRSGRFNDTVTEIGLSIKNSFLVGLNAALPAFQEVGDAFLKLPGQSEEAITVFTVIGEAVRIAAIGFNTLFEVGVILFDKLGTYARVGGRFIIDIIQTIGDTATTRAKQLKALFTLDFDGAAQLGSDLEKRTTERARKTSEEREKLLDSQEARAIKRAERIASVYGSLSKNSLLLGNGSIDEISARQRKATTPQGEANRGLSIEPKSQEIERDRVKEFIEQQRLENQQRREALGDINLTALELRKVTEARKLEADAIKYGKTMTEDQRRSLMLATEEIKAQREQIIQQEFDMRRTYSFGAKEYLREYLDTVTNNANAVKSVFQTTFSSLENTLVDFVQTGKLNFKQFADDVIKELIRIAVRQAVIAPIAGAFSSAISGSSTPTPAPAPAAFANGGVMTARGSLPLNKYSRGGIADSPQLALFGEGRVPEAYVPLQDGRNIPVKIEGGGGSGGVSVSVNVNISRSKEEASVEAQTSAGKNLGQLISNAVVQELIKQRRPGGLLTA